jgi:hypothetical protein
MSQEKIEPKQKPLDDLGARIELLAENVEKSNPESIKGAISDISRDLADEEEVTNDNLEGLPNRLSILTVTSVVLVYLSFLVRLWGEASIANSTAALFNKFIINGELNIDALALAQRAGEISSTQVRDIMDYAARVGEANLSGQIIRVSYLFQDGPTNSFEWVAVNAPFLVGSFIALLVMATSIYYLRQWRIKKILSGYRNNLGLIHGQVSGQIYKVAEEQSAFTVPQTINIPVRSETLPSAIQQATDSNAVVEPDSDEAAMLQRLADGVKTIVDAIQEDSELSSFSQQTDFLGSKP